MGLCRDASGAFLRGFCKPGPGNALHAEMNAALLIGMKLVRYMGLMQVIFEVDSSVVVDLIKKKFSSFPPIKPLIEEALYFLRSPDWTASIASTSREANSCADMLASRGHLGSFDITFVD